MKARPLQWLGWMVALFGGGELAAQEGKIVLANDEWTLSDTGFSNAPDTVRYVSNVTNWFTGDQPGSFLAYSDNFGLTDPTLATTMSNLGHTWLVSTTITFDLPTLQTFDGVFLCGFAADPNVLEDYVRSGGNVYVAGGARNTGGDAQLWNEFLPRFDVALSPFTNGRIGTLPIDVNHPVFHGVTGLYQNNGTDINDQNDADCRGQIYWSEGGNDLYGAYNGSLGLEFDADLLMPFAGDTIRLTAGLAEANGPIVVAAVDISGFALFYKDLLRAR